MTNVNYRTLNVDAYDPDSTLNFPLSSLLPSSLPAPSNASESASIAQQIRQLLRAGDSEGAVRGVLETAPLGGDDQAKQVHLSTVIEVLQGIRQSDVSRVLQSLVAEEGGTARGDTLMKYLYKGMSLQSEPSGTLARKPTGTGLSPQSTGGGFSQVQGRNIGDGGSGQAMSVLLSWHEKLVEIVGVGGIVRVMCDRRTV